MGREHHIDKEEAIPLTGQGSDYPESRESFESSTASLTLALAEESQRTTAGPSSSYPKQYNSSRREFHDEKYRDEEDIEPEHTFAPREQKPQRRARLIFWLVVAIGIGGWAVAFVMFLINKGPTDPSTPHDDKPIITPGNSFPGQKISLDNVLSGAWFPTGHDMSWTPGPSGKDGLLLEADRTAKKGYLCVEDIRNRGNGDKGNNTIVLMKEGAFKIKEKSIIPVKVWPSPDLKTVLVLSDMRKNWRHSFTGLYWLFDVATQTAQPLDPAAPEQHIQLASWSPDSKAIVFTRDNNMFYRDLTSLKSLWQITTDGGPDVFYGVPDWVYEEEVYAGNSATWWLKDGKYVAFLRTDESNVPEFPVQYFLSRPTGDSPPEGEENYPDVRQIKYPKAGAPNPSVSLQFYDIDKRDIFSVEVQDDFKIDDKIIIEVVPVSKNKVLVRQTNRESDIVKILLIDAPTRKGKLIRYEDVGKVDGGWVEPSQSTRYIPADPAAGRPDDGYIDTIIYKGYNHLALFTPLENPNPKVLTSGEWEVVNAPSAVDLKRGLVYFIAAKNSPIERHVYSVKLDGSDFKPLVTSDKPGYYDASFSVGGGYLLLKYQGPDVPWQRLISAPANTEDPIDELIEENRHLKDLMRKSPLPTKHYSNITVDGFTLPVVEMRPRNFDPAKKYPVLFQLYGGPGSQTVSRKFSVNFQTYVVSSLGYLVVTVDGRGTGFNGRKYRCIVRGNLGYYEARDQIETAKHWGKLPYVDSDRIAIWGWSYGGFMALKTLEQDAGKTFQYGMAVAPVTDWRFYDSIYTERYMRTPQNNPQGYDNSSISDTKALSSTVRFLIMHGTADDNVHFQNSLTLLDKLDLAGVNNYDVHVFPDSDHSIFFHHAYKMVHQRLSDWLVNAFNGEWKRLGSPTPNHSLIRRTINRLYSRRMN